MTSGLDVMGAELALSSLEQFNAVIDVRSEAEFAHDHLPGAINLPVLNNAQRAEVGTLHKQASAFIARRRGAALVARNIAEHLETALADKPRDWKPLVYCWRGGQRSGAMTTILNRVGWPARQLEGGYRAYRRAVVAALAILPAQLSFCVICGPTGSGKSKLLRQLKQQGAQVLDLEELACHRGSVLGGLPACPQPSQKAFETALWWTLKNFSSSKPIFVESESRKVGCLQVPEQLLLKIRQSDCVKLEVSIEARVQILRQEYLHFEQNLEAFCKQLDCLVVLHGRAEVERWKTLAADQHWNELVQQLLARHYDPAYQRSMLRNFSSLAQAQVISLNGASETEFATIAQQLAEA